MWHMDAQGSDVNPTGVLTQDAEIEARRPPCQARLRVLAYNEHMQVSRERAKEGASMGELTYHKSVLRALRQLCVEVVAAGSVDEFMPHARALAADPASFDVILTDEYSLKSIMSNTPFDVIKCKLRLMDVWGTPPNQNWHNLHTKQFLVPFPMAPDGSEPWNAVTGYVLEPESLEPGTKKNQGYVWGKEQRYFKNHRELLRRIAEQVPLVVAARPEATSVLPPGVTNLGIVSFQERQRLLRESKFMLGLGDPVLGVSPFEAMAAGCAYLDPQFRPPRKLDQNSRYVLSSQHPYASRVSPPHSFGVALDDHESVAAVQAVLAAGEVAPFVPPEFTLDAVAGALEVNFATDFCGRPGGNDRVNMEPNGGAGKGPQPRVPAQRPSAAFTRRLST